VGLFFGPQSLVLSKDTLHLVDPARVALHLRPDATSPRITLPPKVAVDLHIAGRVGAAPAAWYRVTWRVTSRQIAAGGIPPEDGRPPRLGDERHAYLSAAQAPPPSSGFGQHLLHWIAPIGEIFLRLILMLVVPLVFTTLTVGVAALGDARTLRRAGVTAVITFAATTSIAVVIGMLLALAIGPGRGVDPSHATLLAEQFHFLARDALSHVSETPDLVSFLVQIVPDNPLYSMASARPNILQVMFFSILFGVALTLIPETRSRQVVRLLSKTSKVLEMVMHMAMGLAPVGVFALIAQTVGVAGYPIFSALGGYVGVVILGLVLHAGLVTTPAVSALTPVGARAFWHAIWPAELIALGTASSTATLPVTLQVAEENLGVPQRLSSFTVSLGSSVNMPGTALFQAVALVFIAQAFGVDLPFQTLALAAVTIALLAAGTAAVPSAGLVSLAFVLASVGLPPASLGLIVGVDRLLDMLRTPVNVASDLGATLLVARAAGETPAPHLPPIGEVGEES
ncbi:MAG: dicarboxylate/amino acid:cation symporter, partial [Deltaproteobacteria bacterium]|nr:dicarboxylate/amino acid:cation symporter [Deltaproteobacteria bacterium]